MLTVDHHNAMHSSALAHALGLPLMDLTYCQSPELDTHVVEWCQHYALIPASKLSHIQEIQCGTLAHMTWTSASAAVQAIGAKMIAWLFLFDDEYADGSMRYQPDRLRVIIDATKPFIDVDCPKTVIPQTKWEQSLLDIKQSLLKLNAPHHFLRRLYFSFCDYFESTITEVEYRTHQTPLSFDDYSRFRPSSIGSQVILDYAQLSTSDYLTPEQYNDPALLQTRHQAGFLIALTNDFFSVHKECQEDESYNAALLFCKENAISYEAGISQLQQTHQRLAEELKQLLDQLETHAEGSFYSYSLGIRNWVQGNYEWALRTTRYDRWKAPGECLEASKE